MKTIVSLNNNGQYLQKDTLSNTKGARNFLQLWMQGLMVVVLLLLVQINLVAQNILNAKSNSVAQKIELSVLKGSDAPHTSSEHEYLLKAVNTTTSAVSVNITSMNVPCSAKKSVNINQIIYDTESGETVVLGQGIKPIVIPANSSTEFYIKLVRPFGTELNTWNCVEVKAIGALQKVLSNTITIESFIPDPNDFR